MSATRVTPKSVTTHNTTPSPADEGEAPVPQEPACSSQSGHSSPSSHETSRRSSMFDSNRSHSPRNITHEDARNGRSLGCAIRRLDRELAAQGITHPLLNDIVRATRKQWSPASSKAFYPRKSNTQRRSILAKNAMSATPFTDEASAESETDWSDSMMCRA